MIRLRQEEIESICTAFSQSFLPQDRLWIFGSRVRVEEKGGDIDLYVETAHTDPNRIVDARLCFLSALKQKLGDQKIDVVIQFGNTSLPIYEKAKNEGVRLI